MTKQNGNLYDDASGHHRDADDDLAHPVRGRVVIADVEALLREREGYLRRGRADRVAQVDAVLEGGGIAVEDAPADEADEVEPTEPGEPATDEVEMAVVEPVDVETAVVAKGKQER